MDESIRQVLDTLLERKRITKLVQGVEKPLARHLHLLVREKFEEVLIELGFRGEPRESPAEGPAYSQAYMLAQRMTPIVVGWMIDEGMSENGTDDTDSGKPDYFAGERAGDYPQGDPPAQ